MSAEIKQPQPVPEWRESPQDPVNPPGSVLRDWLTDEGLLTVRLKSACRGTFRVQLLDQVNGPGLMINEVWIRRVILWCGDIPCVYAESHLPHEALSELPTLRSLGNDPLGETLQNHPNVSRGEFDYALMQSPHLPDPLEATARGPLWARRSKFSVGFSSLTVAEVFLPGIEKLQQNLGSE